MKKVQRRTTAEQIAATREEMETKAARMKTLLARQRTEERKARNHRLCERGGHVEKLLPDLAKLTPEQFFVFADKVLLTSFTKRILAELLATDTKTKDGESAQGSGEASVAVSGEAGIQTAQAPAEPGEAVEQAAQVPAKPAPAIASGSAQAGKNAAAPKAGQSH